MTVYFMGLNGVRALSLISLILVFSSTIFVMVTNIKAVNAFEANKGTVSMNDTSMVDCDYIACVVVLLAFDYLYLTFCCPQRKHGSQPARWCFLGSGRQLADYLPNYHLVP